MVPGVTWLPPLPAALSALRPSTKAGPGSAWLNRAAAADTCGVVRKCGNLGQPTSRRIRMRGWQRQCCVQVAGEWFLLLPSAVAWGPAAAEIELVGGRAASQSLAAGVCAEISW